MSGGVDSSVTAALLARAGFDVVGVTLQLYDHGAATGTQGRVLRRPGCARRGAGRRAARHPALRARLRGAVPRRGDRGFRRQLSPRRDAGAVHPLQRADQVPRPARHRARPRRQRAGDRALRPPRARPGRTGTAPRPRRGARPELFPLSHDPRRARFPALSARRPAKDETRALAREFGLPVADKPDSQDICFVPQGSYADLVDAAAAGSRRARRHRRQSGRVLGRHQGSRISRSASARGSASPRAEPLYVLRLDAENRRVVVGPRAALWPRPGSRSAELNWLGDAAGPGAAVRSPPSCARRSRRSPRRCWSATPATPSSCSTRRPARSRRARRRCSTTASGCSAAAGSAVRTPPTERRWAGRGGPARAGALDRARPSPICGASGPRTRKRPVGWRNLCGGVAQLVRAGES